MESKENDCIPLLTSGLNCGDNSATCSFSTGITPRRGLRWSSLLTWKEKMVVERSPLTRQNNRLFPANLNKPAELRTRQDVVLLETIVRNPQKGCSAYIYNLLICLPYSMKARFRTLLGSIILLESNLLENSLAFFIVYLNALKI